MLVGDPKQLPSTVFSPAAKAAGLGVSLFERLVACGVAPVLLTTQHRSALRFALQPGTHSA